MLKVNGNSNGEHAEIDEVLLQQIYDNLLELKFEPLKHITFARFCKAMTSKVAIRFDVLMYICSSLGPSVADIMQEGFGYESFDDKIKLLTATFSSLGITRTDDFALVSGETKIAFQMIFLKKVSRLMKGAPNVEDTEQKATSLVYKLDSNISSTKLNLTKYKKASSRISVLSDKNINSDFSQLHKFLEDTNEEVKTIKEKQQTIIDRGLVKPQDVLNTTHEVVETKKVAKCVSTDCAQAQITFSTTFNDLLNNFKNPEPLKYDMLPGTVENVAPQLAQYLKCMNVYLNVKDTYDKTK